MRQFSFLVLVATISFVGISDKTFGVLVDDFNVSQQVTGPGSAVGFAAEGLGGERDMLVLGDAATSADTNMSNASQLTFIGPLVGSGLTRLQYDGVDGSGVLNPTGLGGVDLTLDQHNSFVLDIVSNTNPGFVTIIVNTDAGNDSAFQIVLPGGITNSTLFFAPYASFGINNGTGADFTNVGALTFFTPSFFPNNSELQIDSIYTAVPEPSSIFLVGFVGGLVSIVMLSRRAMSRPSRTTTC